jgi:O-6-methylguanine DNA methyltransferase
MQLRVERHGSPLGPLLLVTSSDGALRALDFEAYEARMVQLLAQHYGACALAAQQVSRPLADALGAYFAGQLSALDVLPIATGGTLFQRTVWRALRTIPAGETLSYGELAARVGQPGAARAVGLANGKNPIAIVVPCHRVIGADGSLTGYAGGVERKRWLLDHERCTQPTSRAAITPMLAPAL